MYLTKIETNFKGKTRTLDIQYPHIAIIGDNAAGKTAILNAITLPLLGHACDLGARDEAKSASILKGLVGRKEDRAYSKLTFSDGTVASWELRGGKITREAPPWRVSDPFADSYAMLRQGKDNVIRYFVKHFGPEDKLLPEVGLFSTLASGKPWWLAILDVEAEAASVARAHKATMSALEKSAEALGWDIKTGRQPKSSDMQDIYNDLSDRYKGAASVADACSDQMEKWFLANIPSIEAQLRADTVLQDLGIVAEKGAVYVGRRDYEASGPATLPLTSGAETLITALKMASYARVGGPGLEFAILPDKDLDEKTKASIVKFSYSTTLSIVMQCTRWISGSTPHWSIIHV